jgi:hypothetical protein
MQAIILAGEHPLFVYENEQQFDAKTGHRVHANAE